MSGSLAEALARVAAELPADHLAAWTRVLERLERPSGDLPDRLAGALPYGRRADLARDLAAAWRAGAPDLPGPAVALALRAAAHARDAALAENEVTLVVSGPTSQAVPVRLTGAVVGEVIRSARERLLLVSYAAHRVPALLAELRAAARRSVHIDLVLEDELAESPADAFAELGGSVALWTWPEAARPDPAPALHAKLVLADRRTALLGSANLTGRGLIHNLEVGVLLRGREAARLAAHFDALMGPSGPLRRRASR